MKRDIRSYFRCEADYISFMLLYGEGRERIYALNIELELYTDKAAADKWLAWILANSDGEEATKKEIARLYKRMTGEDITKAEETESTEEPKTEETDEQKAEEIESTEEQKAEEIESTEEQKAEEPKKFKVGGAAKMVANALHGGKDEKVMKVTRCYVWITYCGHEGQLTRHKIRKDEKGNEYIEWTERGGYLYTYKAE